MEMLVSGIGLVVSFDPKSTAGKLKLASGKHARFNLEQDGIHLRSKISANMKVNYKMDKRSGKIVSLAPDSMT